MGETPQSTAVGDLTVTSVIDGYGVTRASTFWNEVADVTRFDERTGRPRGQWHGFDPDDWKARPESAAADGNMRIEVGGYLIRGWGERIVLVDAGLGPQSRPILSGGALLRNLAAAGVRPDEVTDVVISHLHFDHVGWAWQQDTFTFPNATVRVHQNDWEFFVGGNQPEGALVRPLEPRVELWDADFTLLPGVDLMLTPGHTPGSAMVLISSGTSRAALLGDAVHCPAELLDEEWAGLGDMDPDLAARTRQVLAREFEDGQVLIGAGHFPGLKFGRLVAGTGKSSWVVSAPAA